MTIIYPAVFLPGDFKKKRLEQGRAHQQVLLVSNFAALSLK